MTDDEKFEEVKAFTQNELLPQLRRLMLLIAACSAFVATVTTFLILSILVAAR